MSLMILRVTDIVFCMLFLFVASGFSQTADRVSMSEWNKALEARPGQQPNQITFASAMKRGSLLMAKGRYPEAIAAFTEAIGQNPGSNEAFSSRGNAKRALTDYEGALADYQKAVSLKPADQPLLITLAGIKIDLRRYDEAIADLNRILVADPDNPDVLASRGFARKQLKDFQGAKADFEKALNIKPDFPFASRMIQSLASSGGAPAAPGKTPAKPLPLSVPTEMTPQPILPFAAVQSTAPPVVPPAIKTDIRPTLPDASQAVKAGGTFQEFDPCKPDINLSDLLWSAVESSERQIKSTTENNSRFNDLLVFSKTRNNHPATVAKAQLAYLMGELSPADQVKFDEKWSFFFRYPSEEVTAYFEKLIPLLADLIEIRNMTTSACLAEDEAKQDAATAQDYENTEELVAARLIITQQQSTLHELDARLKTLAASIEALGDPPNPLANACKARKKHEDAKKITQNALKASIVPKKLKGETGVAYAFKPKLAGFETGMKLLWDFGDGEVKEASAGEVKHVFKKPGRFVVTLLLSGKEKNEKILLAESRVFMTGVEIQPAGAVAQETTEVVFPYQDSFSVPAIPPGCKIKWNQGQKANDAVHEDTRRNNPEKYPYYYLFNFRMHCPGTTVLEKGELNIPYKKTPLPYKIDYYYSGDGSPFVTMTLQYMPNHTQAQLNQYFDFLNHQEQAKHWKPFKFPGWEANGYIKDDQRHGGFQFIGLGENRTYLVIRYNDPIVQFKPESRNLEQCMNGDRRCNKEESKISSDNEQNEKNRRVKVHTDALQKKAIEFISGIKLKGLSTHYNVAKSPRVMTAADEQWLNEEKEAESAEDLKKRQKALAEAENFYLSNVEILQKNLSREQEDYAREQDPERKAAFFFRIMGIQADIQAEKDKINTLHTGKIVHTRTQYDDYVQSKFVERIKEEQEKYVKLERAAAIIRREAKKLPPEERGKAEEFVNKHINGKTLANLDEETVKKAGEAIFNKTQGYNEADAARYEEEAYMWDDYLTRAERVKMAADIGMMGGSFLGGPMALSATYDISTGYFQGGIKEAATQLVLQTGAFALGKYVGAGSKAAAGANDAVVTAKAAARQSGKVGKRLPNAEELKLFQANRARGEKTIKDFENINQSLKNAYLNKASQSEIAAIKKQIREKTFEIQADPHAKNFLKYQGDKLTQTRFNRSIKSVHKEVEKKFYEKMIGDKKWGDFKVKEMRNASSAGSVGMDYDIGLIEKSNFIKMPDGSMKRQYWLAKDGKPATRSMWQKEAQKCWNEAYEEVTLKNAERSWENLTTRIHPESYQDLAVLDGNLSQVSRAWIGQTADVTRYKAMHMLKDGSMSKFEKLQEISRGTAKDLNTKLMPIFENMQKTKQVAAASEHWKKVSSVLDDFGKNKIDPITAERRIAELTGGKSIPEVVDEMAVMMESYVKLGKPLK